MKTIALGKCYEWALTYIRAHEDAVLVHGTVEEVFKKPIHHYKHAWIVEDGLIKDWQCMEGQWGGNYAGIGYPEKIFNRWFKPRNTTSFTAEEARILTVRCRRPGPWPSATVKDVKASLKKRATLAPAPTLRLLAIESAHTYARLVRQPGNPRPPLSPEAADELLDTALEDLGRAKKLDWQQLAPSRRLAFLNAWHGTMQEEGIY